LFLPAIVRTYNAGLSFALLSCSSCGHVNQNAALFSNFTMLSAYCTIALPCRSLARQPCPAALPCSLALQPCPAALPGSLARQPCPAALPGSLARQPCPAALQRQPCRTALPCSFARQPCPAALPGSLARQPCPAALPGSLATAALSDSLAMQLCPAALPCSFARQSYPAALPGSLSRPGSLDRQPFRNIASLITGIGRQNCKLFNGRRPACSITYFCRQFSSIFPTILSLVYKLIRERG
jgi:hypothetical protein